MSDSSSSSGSNDENTAVKGGWGENTDREGRWETVQIKAFTHWVNTVLGQRGLNISDLGQDFQTGVLLANFLELLSRKKMTFTRKPMVKIQEIENLSICVKHIKNECEVRLVGIGAEDIYAGNVKLILGLLWSLFRKFKINTIQSEDKSSEEGLLLWVKTTTADYDGVHITNYTDSFRDGLAFTALIDKYTDGEVNFDDYKDEDPDNRLQLAFEQLEQRANVPKLLDPEEVRTGFVDERALVLYLSLTFHAFKAKEDADAIELRKAELAGKVEREQSELTRMQEAKDALELERDKLNKESAEITAALESKTQSVEELVAGNQKFHGEVEAFRKQVSEQGKQLKHMKKWVEWEREGLEEFRRLKKEREERHKAMAALEVQLKLHAGYMAQMRDQAFAQLSDTFDDEVKPKLLKQMKKKSIDEQVAQLSELLTAEAKRVDYERKSVKRLHEEEFAEAKKAAKGKKKDDKAEKEKVDAKKADAKKADAKKADAKKADAKKADAAKDKKEKVEAKEKKAEVKEKASKEKADKKTTDKADKKADKKAADKAKGKNKAAAAPAATAETAKKDKKEKKKKAEESDSVEEVVVTAKAKKGDKEKKNKKK